MLSALIVVSQFLVVSACQKTAPTVEATTPPAPAAAPVAPDTEGVVVAVDGEVWTASGDQWSELRVGDRLGAASRIKTGRDGVCEVQFGQFAVLRLRPETIVALKTILLSELKRTVQVNLDWGTVVAKVNKLAGADDFGVTTREAHAGVRGTRFVVTKRNEKTTQVTVAEGRVALAPATLQPGRAAPALLEVVWEVSPAVTAGESVVVGPRDYEALADRIEAMPAEPTAQDLDQYRQQVKALPAPAKAPASAAETSEAESLELKARLPDAPPEAPAAPAPQPLASPAAVFPQAHEVIDIRRQAELNLSWQPVAGAVEYRVALRKVGGAAVKSWTTKETQVGPVAFDQLQEGAFQLEVTAVASDPALNSRPRLTPFVLSRGGDLNATTLELSDN